MSLDQLILVLIVAFVSGETFSSTQLVGTNSIGNPMQGSTVALSRSGNILLSGGPYDSNSIGSAWVFNRTNEKNVNIQKLVPFPQSAFYFGTSVAISASEQIIAIGGAYANQQRGVVWIFIRNETGYYLPQTRLLSSGATIGEQGSTVTLSDDGNILAFSSLSLNEVECYNWNEMNFSWIRMGSPLIGNDLTGSAGFGTSLALSSNGNTLAIGGPYDNDFIGATWIFILLNQTWIQQGPKLIGVEDSESKSQQGTSIALSNNGNILAVGAPAANNNIGGVYIFIRNEITSIWSQVGPILTGSGGSGPVYQGVSIDLSDDGNILVIGGEGDSAMVGAVWLFIQNEINNSWTQFGEKLVGMPTIYLGASVSICGDGSVFVAGAPYANLGVGSVWVFSNCSNCNVDGGDTDNNKLSPEITFLIVIFPIALVSLFGYFLYTYLKKKHKKEALLDVNGSEK